MTTSRSAARRVSYRSAIPRQSTSTRVDEA
jgi:hypothetical protein